MIATWEYRGNEADGGHWLWLGKTLAARIGHDAKNKHVWWVEMESAYGWQTGPLPAFDANGEPINRPLDKCLTCGAPGMQMTQTWSDSEGHSGESTFTVPWCAQHPPERPCPSPGFVGEALAPAPSPEQERLIAWCRSGAAYAREFLNPKGELFRSSSFAEEARNFDAIAEALEAQGAARPLMLAGDTDALRALREAQATFPSMRLGQLIENARKENPDLFYLRDDELALALREYVLNVARLNLLPQPAALGAARDRQPPTKAER